MFVGSPRPATTTSRYSLTCVGLCCGFGLSSCSLPRVQPDAIRRPRAAAVQRRSTLRFYMNCEGSLWILAPGRPSTSNLSPGPLFECQRKLFVLFGVCSFVALICVSIFSSTVSFRRRRSVAFQTPFVQPPRVKISAPRVLLKTHRPDLRIDPPGAEQGLRFYDTSLRAGGD